MFCKDIVKDISGVTKTWDYSQKQVGRRVHETLIDVLNNIFVSHSCYNPGCRSLECCNPECYNRYYQ